MKFRIKDNRDQYEVVSDIVTELVNKIYKDYRPGDLIIFMGFKYDYEKEYTYENLLLFQNEFLAYDEWSTDWCEGQRCIELIGFIPVEEVVTRYNFFDGKLMDNRATFQRDKEVGNILKKFGGAVEYD